MFRIPKYYCWLAAMIFCAGKVSGQLAADSSTYSVHETPLITPLPTGDSLASYRIGKIIITGNKRTRENIILREIPFRPGEYYTLPDLVRRFEVARRQLLNTVLFHDVVVALNNTDGSSVDVNVDVKERWYIFPVPYLRPVDRNLNQWLFEQNASLSRVNYGLKVLHNNFTGRNDKFRFMLVAGYTKQFSVSYDRLYIDKKMNWGLNTAFSIGKNKELNYNTINNKQVFLKDDEYVRKYMNATAEITYRRAIKTRHRFGISYTRESVSDTIINLNPTFFKDGTNSIEYPEIYYSMKYYDLDYIPYPTKGYAAEVWLGKKGINNKINVWHLTAKGSGSWHTGKKSFVNVIAFGNIRAPFKQPYYTQRLLGYSDAFMQGYEYYVIDGVAGAFLKTTFTRELLNFSIKSPDKKGRLPERIPFRIYAKVYGNAGYVHNPQPGDNSLSNRMLYSGGFGFDIFTAYDFTLKLEWTFNQLGQNGLFLHRKSIF